MKNSFDKLYNLIMEQGYNLGRHDDPGANTDFAAYSLSEVGKGNTELYGLYNGQQVIDPRTGQPIKWEWYAVYKGGRKYRDYITGEMIRSNTNALCFPISKAGISKMNIYVKPETYFNAYESGDEATIAKLQEIGLDGGFYI